MQFIKNIMMAHKVCKKYGAEYSPFTNLKIGSFAIDKGEDIIYKRIFVNPFNKNFKAVFFHEVGHIRLFCNGMQRKWWTENWWYGERYYGRSSAFTVRDRPLIPLLREESRASRFAVRVCKNKEDTNFLVKCFQTYSKQGYMIFKDFSIDASDIGKYTDVVYKCIRGIEK